MRKLRVCKWCRHLAIPGFTLCRDCAVIAAQRLRHGRPLQSVEPGVDFPIDAAPEEPEPDECRCDVA